MQSNDQIIERSLKIPGWGNKEILSVLGKYASAVNENGTILEIGGLFGRSTHTLGLCKKESVKLITVDIWPTMDIDTSKVHDGLGGVRELLLLNSKITPTRIETDAFYDLWKEYTKDVLNLEGIKAHSNINNDTFPMFDLIYHDAGHTFFDVFRDLNHWFPKLKPDGVIIIDDYEIKTFPGVMGAVDLFLKVNPDLISEMVTSRNILLRRK